MEEIIKYPLILVLNSLIMYYTQLQLQSNVPFI